MKSDAFKVKTCVHCGGEFIPARMGQKVCFAYRCVMGNLKAEKAAAKADIKRRKEALKRIPDLIREAQTAVNKYCRLRDLHAGKGCISCGAKPDQRYGGTMDAGHFRSVGSSPHLRFLTSQIRLQCVRCNRYMSGNVNGFRAGLVAERGRDWVEWLEALNWVRKWDRDYLIRLRRVMQKKACRMEKRMEAA